MTRSLKKGTLSNLWVHTLTFHGMTVFCTLLSLKTYRYFMSKSVERQLHLVDYLKNAQ